MQRPDGPASFLKSFNNSPDSEIFACEPPFSRPDHTSGHNSLVITALKNGAVYVVPLNSSKDNVQGDVRTYFHSANRYRVAALNPKGDKIYIATDVKGNVVGMDGKHTGKLANPGAILEFTYQP